MYIDAVLNAKKIHAVHQGVEKSILNSIEMYWSSMRNDIQETKQLACLLLTPCQMPDFTYNPLQLYIGLLFSQGENLGLQTSVCTTELF